MYFKDDSENKYLILYPLCNVKVESTLQFENGLSIIASDDNEFWKAYASQFVDATLLNLSTGKMLYDTNNISWSNGSAKCWLAYEYKGFSAQMKKIAPVEMRALISVILCILQKNRTLSTIKNSKFETDFILHFPHKSTPTGFALTYTSSAPIFPSLIEETFIKSNVLAEVNKWYDSMLSADMHLRNRMRVAAFTLTDAIISTGSDRLLKCFMVIDALFGVNGVVGDSFKNGLHSALKKEDPLIISKAEYLYKLRCAFMHGDIIFHDDWKEYDLYFSTFETDPIDDMLKIILNSILKYFDIGREHIKHWQEVASKKNNRHRKA